MTYSVKELFLTLQGEGARVGRRAVFCRFSGCNLWSGLEKNRADAMCNFCDTDFVGTDGNGGGKFKDADNLANQIEKTWQDGARFEKYHYVVFTSGEPGLQLDSELVNRLHERGFECAVETNGTVTIPNQIDWITVSPKTREALVTASGNELKLVYPQLELDPMIFNGFEFDHFFLQPMDTDNYQDNLRKAVAYCLRNPGWRLSLQTHKVIGID